MVHGVFLKLSVQYSLGMLSAAVMAILGSFFLGLVTEQQKDRWRRFLDSLMVESRRKRAEIAINK
jgi:hypothetical protein